MRQSPEARNGHLRFGGRSPAFRSPCCCPRSAPASPMSALPTLAQAFNASFQEVQWIVLAYLLAITTLIVSVGRLGDIIGRRRLLLAGIFLFTVASVLCGVAPTLWLLIAARAAQGLGAAIMMALTMAFVGETVPKARTGSAMGLLGTMSAIGTALGPSLGGVLIAGLGWRAIFLVNVPLGILTFLLAHRYLPVDRRGAEDGSGRLRPCGHAAAGSDARGLCARHDDRARQFRSAQPGPAAGCRRRSRPLRARRGESRIAFDPVGDVPRSGAEREPRHERARLDGDDGDAGGRAVLSLARARARRGPGRTRPVGRSAGRRADRRAGRPHRGPFRRTAHDHRRARRNGGRFLSCSPCCRRRSASPATSPPSSSSPPAMRCSRRPTTPPS